MTQRLQPLEMAVLAQAVNNYHADAASRQAEEQARAIQDEQAKARRKIALKDLIGTLRTEEIARELATHERLESQLAGLRAKANALTLQLATAEAAWERAAEHTLTDAQLLQTLRDETPKVLAQIAPLEAQLVAVEERIAELRGAQEAKQHKAPMQQFYTPTVERLAPVVRQLLTLLAEQRQVRDTLQAEGAWVYAPMDVLAIDAPRGEDMLTERLILWLAEAQRVGYKV